MQNRKWATINYNFSIYFFSSIFLLASLVFLVDEYLRRKKKLKGTKVVKDGEVIFNTEVKNEKN